jgi:thiol-disulfide isomerase/thioredoxin
LIEALSLGPLLVPTWPVAVVISLWIAVLSAGRLAAWWHLDGPWLRGVAEGTAWVGVIGARLGYVIANWSAFRMEPWTGFYFWQPGYLPYTGVIAGTVYAIWRIVSGLPAKRWVHLRALCSGYVGGAIALGVMTLALYSLAPPTLLGRGDRVPDFSLADLDGNTVRLSELRGQGLILNFWATWCPPCRREMPLLDEIHVEYGPRGLSVIGIDLGESPDVVASFLREAGVHYPVWVDPVPLQTSGEGSRAIHERFGGAGLPTTVFVDRRGTVRDVHVGELNRAFLRQQAKRILSR